MFCGYLPLREIFLHMCWKFSIMKLTMAKPISSIESVFIFKYHNILYIDIKINLHTYIPAHAEMNIFPCIKSWKKKRQFMSSWILNKVRIFTAELSAMRLALVFHSLTIPADKRFGKKQIEQGGQVGCIESDGTSWRCCCSCSCLLLY